MQKSGRARSPGRRLTALLALITVAITIARSAARNVATDDMDISIKPGDDFYRYANGGWLKTNTIPVGQSSYDTRAMLAESTSQRVRDLIQDAASAHAVKGSITQKIGDYYASFLDQNSIDAKGLLPLADEMTQIAAINDTKSLSAYLGTTLNTEADGLTHNADHVFGIWINQGFEDFDHNLPHLWQGGLGLPDRDDYLDSSPKTATLRNQYQSTHWGDIEAGRSCGSRSESGTGFVT